MSEERAEQTRTLEEIFAEVEALIEQMENPEIALEESFLLYQKGVEELKACNELLDKVEKKMLVLTANGSLEEM